MPHPDRLVDPCSGQLSVDAPPPPVGGGSDEACAGGVVGVPPGVRVGRGGDWVGAEPDRVAEGLAVGDGVADGFAFDALGDGLPEAAAVDAGVVAVVIGLAGRPSADDPTFAQPAAIPMMSDAPIIMRTCLRPPRPNCMPIPFAPIRPKSQGETSGSNEMMTGNSDFVG